MAKITHELKIECTTIAEYNEFVEYLAAAEVTPTNQINDAVAKTITYDYIEDNYVLQ